MFRTYSAPVNLLTVFLWESKNNVVPDDTRTTVTSSPRIYTLRLTLRV